MNKKNTPKYKRINNFIFGLDDIIGSGTYGKVYKGYYYIEGQASLSGDMVAIKQTHINIMQLKQD